jgi:membrane fusion protein (multidrug efflux system)
MVYPPQPRASRFPWRLIVVLLVLVGIGYAAYGFFFSKPATPPAPPPPAVTTQTIEKTDIPLVFEYAARLAGSREVEIRARVSGILQKRAYTEGQFVRRGDLLFLIDPEPFKAALAEAKAGFQQTDRDYRRAVTLKRQKALSAREFDEAESLYQAAKARVDTAKINLGYTTVRSPISGYTSQENNSEGTLVTADTTLLTRVTQLDPIYVEFAYPDSEAMLQRRGVADGTIALPKDKLLRVEIVMNDGTVYPDEAAIRFTDSIINTETGTVRARAVLKNDDQAIMPGQFVRVRVKGLTQVESVGIPEQAIMQGPQGTFVYTVNAESKATMTPVELGLLNNGVRIIKKGLKEGDKVVIEGMIKVQPGQPVKVDAPQDAMPAAPASEEKPGSVSAKKDDAKE